MDAIEKAGYTGKIKIEMDITKVPITKAGMYNLFFYSMWSETQGNSNEWEDSVEESWCLFT